MYRPCVERIQSARPSPPMVAVSRTAVAVPAGGALDLAVPPKKYDLAFAPCWIRVSGELYVVALCESLAHS